MTPQWPLSLGSLSLKTGLKPGTVMDTKGTRVIDAWPRAEAEQGSRMTFSRADPGAQLQEEEYAG